MTEKQLLSPGEIRNLALALVQALQMWSNKRYSPFLVHAKPGELTEEWFRWFVGAWNVARTIKDGRQGFVRQYLDRDFRKELLEGGGAETVDAAAEHIQQQGWSSPRTARTAASPPSAPTAHPQTSLGQRPR